MNPRLGRSFFARDTLVVARELLGQRLVAAGVEGRTSGFIVEVEAYVGEGDRASHARSGPTQRNRAMYGPAGCAYVYFIYGMHYCLNIVTGEDGFPAAVLIRALEPVEGTQEMETRRGGKRGVELATIGFSRYRRRSQRKRRRWSSFRRPRGKRDSAKRRQRQTRGQRVNA